VSIPSRSINRAAPLAAQCEIGMVKLLEGRWNQAFIDEVCAFQMQAMTTRWMPNGCLPPPC
jgi:phage terminase large subunit-like protein